MSTESDRENTCEKNAGRYASIIVAIGAPLLCAMVSNFGFTPVYRTNDDIGIAAFASGQLFAVKATPFLMFTNILYGDALTTLYAATATLPWHKIALTVLHVASSVTICRLILGGRVTYLRMLLVGVYLIPFDMYLHFTPTFTISAILAALAAAALWWFRLANPEQRTTFDLAMFFFLAISSFCVRPAALYLVVLMTTPFVLLPAPPVRQWFADLREGRVDMAWRRCWPVAVVVACVITLVGYDRFRYATNADWDDFYEFNQLRAEFNDYRRGDGTDRDKLEQCAAAAGWSLNDYDMVRNWWFVEPEIYNIGTFRKVLSRLPRKRLEWHTIRYQVVNDLSTESQTGVLMRVILVTMLAGMSGVATPLDRIRLVAFPVVAFCLAAYITISMKYPPPHVTDGMLAASGAWFLIILANGEPPNPKANRAVVIRVLMLLTLLWSSAMTLGRMQHAEEGRREQAKEIEWLLHDLENHPDCVFISWGTAVSLEYLPAWKPLARLKEIHLIPIGSATQTEPVQTAIKRLGITNLRRALFERDNVYVICSPLAIDMLVEHIWEHDNVRVEASHFGPDGVWSRIWRSSRHTIVRFVRKPTVEDPSVP